MSLRTLPKLVGIYFLLTGLAMQAQVPANLIGLNPSNLKWRQIKTDKVQVLFPEGLENSGQYVANLVHYLWENDTEATGGKNDRVTLLLLNQGVTSNGLVTVGPFRSELFTVPPQFDCTSDWLLTLTVHEYRHVKQFINARKGITGLVRKVLGSWPFGGFMAMALPRWYFEGGAIQAETAFSRSGRGRLPAFNMEFRALRLSNRHYGYEKAAAGSLKDFVPDWYPLGYHITTYARQKFGGRIWADVAEDAVRYRKIFFPLSKSLQKRTGMRAPELYQAAMTSLDSFYHTSQAKAQERQDVQVPHRSKQKSISSYFNAHYLRDGKILAEKRAFHHWPAIISIDENQKEKTLVRPGVIGNSLNSTLSYSNGQFCWAEHGFDLRWANRDYSIIKVHNVQNGKTRKLTHRSRYFAPALSPDGTQIVAIEVDKLGISTIVFLNVANGAVLKRLPNPDGFFYSFPRWLPDGKSVVVVAKKNELHHLQKVSTADGGSSDLTKPLPFQLTHPFPQGKNIFYAAAYTGVNNIFAVDLDNKAIRQITDAAFGAFQPSVSPDGQRLIYSSFTADGYRLESMELDPAQWIDYAPLPQPENFPYTDVIGTEASGSIVPKIPTEQFPIKKFHSIAGLIRPHSFLPLVSPPILGASILSDDKFSTMSASANAYYNLNEEEWTFTGDLTYAGLFPIFNASLQQSDRSSLQRHFTLQEDSSSFAQNVYIAEWQERRLTAGLAIPLNLSAGRFFNRLRLSGNYQYIDVDNDNRFDDPNNFRDTMSTGRRLTGTEDIFDLFRNRFQSDQVAAVDLRFNFLSLQRLALQHLRSRLGINFEARYRTLLNSNQLSGDVFSVRADLFLPGIGPNHSILINGYHQEIDELDNYRFPNFFVYPRGYAALTRSQVSKIGFNYSLPLYYPDLAIGPFAFLKRVKVNLFADFGRANSKYFVEQNFNSAGLELNVDFRLFRLVEVDCGVRYSRISEPRFGLESGQANQFEFVLISITQ
ncbi:MAG: hypothetical protein AAF990_23365 [Bacteroidota bacterium]